MFLNEFQLAPAFPGAQLYPSAAIQSTYLSPGKNCCEKPVAKLKAFGLHTHSTLVAPSASKMSWMWRQAWMYCAGDWISLTLIDDRVHLVEPTKQHRRTESLQTVGPVTDHLIVGAVQHFGEIHRAPRDHRDPVVLDVPRLTEVREHMLLELVVVMVDVELATQEGLEVVHGRFLVGSRPRPASLDVGSEVRTRRDRGGGSRLYGGCPDGQQGRCESYAHRDDRRQPPRPEPRCLIHVSPQIAHVAPGIGPGGVTSEECEPQSPDGDPLWHARGTGGTAPRRSEWTERNWAFRLVRPPVAVFSSRPHTAAASTSRAGDRLIRAAPFGGLHLGGSWRQAMSRFPRPGVGERVGSPARTAHVRLADPCTPLRR